MSAHQPISIFEQPPAKKPYSAWGIVSLVYLFLTQAIIIGLGALAILEEATHLDDYPYSPSESLFNNIIHLLIYGKLLIACFFILSPFIAFAIRRQAALVLLGSVYYFFIAAFMFIIPKLHSLELLHVLPVSIIFILSLLCIICLNREAARQFYKVLPGQKGIWWNAASLIFGTAWAVFLFYNAN